MLKKNLKNLSILSKTEIINNKIENILEKFNNMKFQIFSLTCLLKTIY